jgi:hypothetical protein
MINSSFLGPSRVVTPFLSLSLFHNRKRRRIQNPKNCGIVASGNDPVSKISMTLP